MTHEVAGEENDPQEFQHATEIAGYFWELN